MEKPTECAFCGKMYDRAAYGTGFKYCKPACKWAARGEALEDSNPCGRPRRFDKATSLLPTIVKKYLEARDFLVFPGEPTVPEDDHLKLRLAVRRGHTRFKICVGGNPHSLAHNESWAEICAHSKDGSLTFTSTCRKQPTIKHIPMGTAGKTKASKICVPCKKDSCHKCSRWKHFCRILATAAKYETA